MKKLIKYLVILTGGLVVFAGLVLVVLFTVIDPNRYRPAMENVFAEQTGLVLDIAGDVDWSFRPVFGFAIRDVRLGNGVTPQELASFSEVSLRLSPLAMLRGELRMQEFIARNLHINWHVDEQGQANWLVDTGREPAPQPRPQRSGEITDIPISVDIEQITISNARLSVRDLQQSIDTSVENLDITSSNTNLDDRPFPFSISSRIVDRSAGRDLYVNLEALARIDLAAGNLALDELRFNLSPLVLRGELAVSNFHDNPAWSGELSSNTFNLDYLLENFMEVDAGPGIDTDSNQFAMALAFSGDERGATLSSLELSLDEMHAELSGDLLYANADRPAAVAYQLQANALDLDRWLPEAAEDEVAEEEEAVGEALPFALLNDFNLRGNHEIESLRVAGLQFDDIDVEIVVENGLLDAQTLPIGFYGGEIAARVQVNGAEAPARIDSRLSLDNIRSAGLAEQFRLLEPFTGRLDLDAEHSMRGDTVSELSDSIAGITAFNITDGSADITLVKRVFDAISVLSPDGDMTGGWPDEVRFSDMTGQLLFNEGLASGQELSLRIDNFDVTGTGGIDLAEERFLYDLDFTVLGEPAPQTIAIRERYRNIAWPVRCDAAFDSPPLQYCSPDLQRVRALFGDIARGEVERRARDAASDQLEELEDRARGLLDRLRR